MLVAEDTKPMPGVPSHSASCLVCRAGPLAQVNVFSKDDALHLAGKLGSGDDWRHHPPRLRAGNELPLEPPPLAPGVLPEVGRGDFEHYRRAYAAKFQRYEGVRRANDAFRAASSDLTAGAPRSC